MKHVPLRDRMTEQDKQDLFNRKQTVRDLARKYGVSENYLSHAMPDRAPKRSKGLLMQVRRMYIKQIVRETHEGKHSIFAAASLICKSERTVFRLLAKHRQELKA